jgi:hypothetical protein
VPDLRAAVLITPLLLAALAVPASAGSEDDPEVRGAGCGPEAVRVGGTYEVCKAWFTARVPAPGDAQRVTTTVQVADALEGSAAPARVAMTWRRADGCREGWQRTDLVGGPTELVVVRRCGDGPLVTSPLDPARAVVRGRTVTVELSGQDLRAVGSHLAPGDRLGSPVAGARLLVRPVTGGAEVATLGGDTPAGRDFVLPS